MPVIKNLQNNLKKQVGVYNELKELADLKQKALVANHLQELEAVTVREEQLLMEASRLDKERLLWADQVAKAMGKAAEELTLSELVVKYPELQSVNQELENVVTDLKDVHELNTQLLQQAMKIVNFTVGMLTHKEATTYGKPGQKENPGSSTLRIVDRSI